MGEEDVAQMVEDYLERTGIKTLPAGMETEASEEHGFIRFCVAGDELFCPDIYGAGRYWEKRLKEIARERGVSRITGVARTDRIEAYCRMFGCKVTGYVVEWEAE